MKLPGGSRAYERFVVNRYEESRLGRLNRRSGNSRQKPVMALHAEPTRQP
jgi:hypothetical protein